MSAESGGKIFCAICQQPIVRRRDLLLKAERLFQSSPLHYTCYSDSILKSGQSWQKIDFNALNSFWLRFVVIVSFLLSLFIALFGGLNPGYPGALFMLFYLFWMGLAYFKYERKVPK